MMADEFGVAFYKTGKTTKAPSQPPVEKKATRADSMNMLYNHDDLNQWLAKYGNPGCKRPGRYPAFAVMNGRKAAVYGLIELNNNSIPDLQIWRLVSNYLYRSKVDPQQNFRIVLKAIVMNPHQGPDTNHSRVMEPDLDVTHLLVDLFASKPRYCFHPQHLVEAIPDIGKYANLKVWNWRIALEIVPVR